MKKFVVPALLALSLIPLAAPAARANVPSYEQRHDAKAFAQWYWRDYRGLDNPCPYGVKLRFERMPARMAGVLGFHRGYSCTIHLDVRRNWWWYRLCGLVTHEMGHVYGLGHSRNPNSIMYPQPMVAGNGRFWSCTDANEAPPGYF
jgi:hypothetical protein